MVKVLATQRDQGAGHADVWRHRVHDWDQFELDGNSCERELLSVGADRQFERLRRSVGGCRRCLKYR